MSVIYEHFVCHLISDLFRAEQQQQKETTTTTTPTIWMAI